MNKPEILIKSRETIPEYECSPPRPLKDEEWFKYGRRRPTLEEWNEILKSPKKVKEMQNTYGYSDDDIAGIRTCNAQQG